MPRGHDNDINMMTPSGMQVRGARVGPRVGPQLRIQLAMRCKLKKTLETATLIYQTCVDVVCSAPDSTILIVCWMCILTTSNSESVLFTIQCKYKIEKCYIRVQ